MKSWLKGGVIGAGIGLILIALIMIIGRVLGHPIVYIIPTTLGFPWSFILAFIPIIDGIHEAYWNLVPIIIGGVIDEVEPLVIPGFIGLIINGFIIGALIGKFKSKKNKIKSKK